VSLQGTPRGPDFWDAILRSDSDMYAAGHWTWEEFERMRDMHLRWEQDDHARLTSIGDPCRLPIH